MVVLALFTLPATAADTIQTLATGYQPTITQTVDAAGFTHPGVGLTKAILENLRTQVLAQKEPWNSHFNAMLLSSAASKTAVSSNRSGADPSKPANIAFNSNGVNSQFIADGQKAFTQAVLYLITGDETYRANALAIVRIWAQMDPTQYAYFDDAHIHTGVPMVRMITAAEILRATSYQTASLQWTDTDTANFTNNLIVPATAAFNYSNGYFMNQHLYPLMGSMAGYIFTGNRSRYNEAVEWFTVNSSAVDQGKNGAIKRLFRLVDKNDVTGAAVSPAVVQLVEMGRDQAHSAGDLTNVEVLSRMLMAQATKVDPVAGTPSTASNAVGPYEFLNDRILDTADYWGRYMLGYDTPWVPTAAYSNADGTPNIVYKVLAGGYRGRLTQNTWGAYYYYKYTRGINMDQRAPYFTEAYRRHFYNWDGVDGGGEFWLYIPAEAVAEGSQFVVRPIVEPLREFEDRVTSLDGNSQVVHESTVAYARVTATAAGSKIALTSYANSSRTIAFRIRTNGIATMDIFGDSIALPNTNNQWRFVTYALNDYQWMGDMQFVTIKGAGTTVDLDYINLQPGTALTAPAFTDGEADVNLYTYSGSTSALTRSFAATDANTGDTVTYQIDGMPSGATFNTSTGAFSWKPTQSGTYTFAVTATDGSTVNTKMVKVVVTADRSSAVAAANAGFQSGTIYTSGTRSAYDAAYAAAVAAISGTTDDVFAAKLAALGSAVDGLQLLSPLLDDGSLNYAKMLATSTFGTQVPNALDNQADTFVGYYLAQNLAHTLDFGVNYKIAASAFQIQVRASFPTRIGGVAIFGSNDNETWTRLTPGLTSAIEDMQTLAVQDDLKDDKFRFIKIQMIQPSSNMLELSEFRIIGTRYEAVNQLTSVSLSSDQSVKSRIVPGDTVKVSFTASAPINTVRLTVLGLPVTASSTDNLNWTATVAAPALTGTAPVKLVLNYKTAAGVDADTTYFTTDGSSLFVSDESKYIANLMDIAALTDSSGRTATDLRATVNSLIDKNIGTFTDFRVNGSGSGAWVMFDMKQDGSATISRFELLARQDQVGRIGGTVLQGSNDGASWTTISNAAVSSAEWQQLPINVSQAYRYLRVFNGNAWYGNMAELRIHGVAQANRMGAVSLSSPQALRNRVAAGSTVKLTFAAKEAVTNVGVVIQGQAASISTADNINFVASAVLPANVPVGTVTFTLNYQLPSGMSGTTVNATTDGSTLYVADESDTIKNLPTIATLIDSTVNRSAATTLAVVNSLFDSTASISDFRTGTNNSGSGAYITFDMNADGAATLTGVDLLARQDQYSTRIAGTVVQGSNDNATWTNLTGAAVSTQEWQQMAVSNTQAFRYIRVYNWGAWYGNMAELRLHGVAQASKITAVSVSSPQALRGRIAKGASVTLTFSAKEAINNVRVTIQGQTATVSTTDNLSFTATATLPQNVTPGALAFTLNYQLQSGMNGATVTATTDGTALTVADESDTISNLTTIATLIDSTLNRSAATTLAQVNNLLDSNPSISDFRTGTNNSGSGAYIIFDFKAGNSAVLSKVDLLARQDGYYTRAAGVVIQGSNDASNWTTLTPGAASTMEWQTLAVSGTVPYRYIRIYNWNNWYGNLAEVRLHGTVTAN